MSIELTYPIMEGILSEAQRDVTPLNIDRIKTLCGYAYKQQEKKVGMPRLSWYILMLEGYNPRELDSKFRSDIFSQLWNKKYSRCYCDYEGLRGPLDAIALHSLNTDWVYWLYDTRTYDQAKPRQHFGNINKIRMLDHRINRKGTILDYLIYLLNSDDYSINDGDAYSNKIKDIATRLKEFGAKRMSEMTPEEIEENKR